MYEMFTPTLLLLRQCFCRSHDIVVVHIGVPRIIVFTLSPTTRLHLSLQICFIAATPHFAADSEDPRLNPSNTNNCTTQYSTDNSNSSTDNRDFPQYLPRTTVLAIEAASRRLSDTLAADRTAN